MSKVVISGYYGFGNAGDEAMLSAIITAIRKEEGDAHITVISGHPAQTSAKHGVEAVGTFAGPAILKALMNCDLLISGGGSLLQDATSVKNVYYYLSIMSLAKLLGKRVVLYAQGIGPLTKPTTRWAVKSVLNRMDLITVRDLPSQGLLEEIGVKPELVQVTADAVLTMPIADASKGEARLQAAGLKPGCRRIGIAVRSWKNQVAYRKSLAGALATLHQSHQVEVLFIPMSHPEDTEEAKQVAAYMGNAPYVHLLEESFTTSQFLELAGAVDIMIGVRLHALVFASLMGKPVVGISYDPKIDAFLHMIEQEAMGTMERLDQDTLYTRLVELLEGKGDYQHSFDRIESLRKISFRSAQLAMALLKQ